MNWTRIGARVAAVIAVASLAVSPAHARQGTARRLNRADTRIGHGGGRVLGSVYVCRACKTAYTGAQARRLSMKDARGHRLVRLSRIPMGYKMAPMIGLKMAPRKAGAFPGVQAGRVPQSRVP